MKALILVDLENEWISPDSDYYVGDISKSLDKINNLIDFCRNNGDKIIFVRHIERGSDSAFVENSRNVEIIESLHKLPQDSIISKYKISPFYETNLAEELAGIQEIIVGGILTNLCVRSLIQDAYDRDFVITVIKDCCITKSKEIQEFTFRDLRETRTEINFMDLFEFLQATKKF
ncbi:MAG: cysteine hydrolase [Candidatus Gracilibacteria bacterium]|nr:cysteine hydrolase [Candidatus Gracilibacteria bacterium]MDD4530555.1 cysteine hydrolase [Candidatus Gracilibacteria bacterium]